MPLRDSVSPISHVLASVSSQILKLAQAEDQG